MTSLPDLPDERLRGQPWRDGPSPLSQHTWPQRRASTTMQRAAKAARVHTLTDPLGAKGFRATGMRVRTETSARRKVLLASVATFAASFGVIVATNQTPTDANSSASTPAAASGEHQTDASSASSVGTAVDLFTNQTTSGLAGATSLVPTATSAAKQQDHEEDDDDHVATGGETSLLPTQASDDSSSQIVTNSQPTEAPIYQEPSHTRSGGS